MVEKITKEKLWHWIEIEDEEFDLESFRARHKISSESDAFYTAISRFVNEHKIKRLGRSRYRRVKPVVPIKWWDDAVPETPLDFMFPMSHEDWSSFGIEDLVEVYKGDLILLSGVSNYGKTALALNILAENIDLMPAVLMGSEYTAADGKISPKFKRRLTRMNWIEWVVESKPRFQLYPVGSDYEDYIQADSLNIIDWVSLPGEYYMIDSVMKAIKDKIGHGIVVIVLQKNKASEWGEGGERTERYADVSLMVDPFGETESMVTLGKVKAPKGKATGRKWAFRIVDFGANLHNIREMVRCYRCHGRGTFQGEQCSVCKGKKYVNKDKGRIEGEQDEM